MKDIYGNTLVGGVPLNFVVSEIPINPGIEGSFPWLSQVAQNFEEYSIKQLVYSYKSTLSDVNSANGQVGSIVTATNYNPSLPGFKDKATMMQYAHAHTTVATMNNVHGVEANPRKLSGPEGKFIRVNTVLDNEDIKTYDHGKFQIAVCGTPTALADLPIGELWVEYTIELRKPKLFTGIGSAISTFTARNNAVPDNSTLNGVFPLGDLASSTIFPCINKNSTLPITITKSSNADGTILQFPDYFSGYVSLEIRLAFTAALYDQYRLRAPGLLGNIQVVNDLTVSSEFHEVGYPSTGLVGFVHNPPAQGTSAGERMGLTLVAHYHVGLPSHGIKNQLVWGTNTGAWLTGDSMVFRSAQATLVDWADTMNGIAIPDGDVDGCEITISEYNSPLDTTPNMTWTKASDGSDVVIS